MEKARKTLNLIALAVFLGTNLLTPISYAVDDLENVGENLQSEISSESVGSNHDIVGGSLSDLENDDNESSGTEGEGSYAGNEQNSKDSSAEPQNDDSTSSRAKGNEGEGSSNNSKTPMDSHVAVAPQNDDSTSSRAEGNEGEGSSKTPMDSDVADAPQNDNEQPDGQEGTTENSAIDELKELIENEENNSEIIESEEIYGTGEYEGVKVGVYAQTGAFPLGTILNIIPITGDDEMSDIQDVLEQQKNVEKSQKVIAFDVTFLDPETEEELQPLMTGAVQVTFNYEENDELVAAEENEDQEVKVYHLNDKDEEGEKIESITGTIVEDVEVNEEITEELSEEIENVVVVNAESFSYYTIVVQRREEAPESAPTQTWQYGEDKDYLTISIARPSSYSATDYPIEGFTIMDRNLGASISGTTCDTTSNNTGACGYLYQWGNNYGFPISADASSILTGVGLTWDDSYNNNGYVSKKFVNGSSFDYDVWDGTNPTANNEEHHDGVWGGENDVNYDSKKNSNGLYWDDGGDRNLRQGPCPEGWHVPSAGEWSMLVDYWYYTNYSTHPSKNSNLYYFSNSTKRQAFMDYFYIPFAGYRNLSDASLNLQGSLGLYWSSSPSSAGSNYARNLRLNSSNVYANDNSRRASGLSVRCFKDSYVASPESSNLVDTQAWVEGEDFETITISDPNDPTNKGFTIMDRNLGATTGNIASTGSYGFKYQWGNNHGFSDSESVIAVSQGLTWNSIYNNHGYFSTNFINGDSHDYDVWDGTNPTANGKEHHDGLWGGANDVNFASEPNGVNGLYWDDGGDRSLRQGPCPVGYHVPSAGEWSKLLEYWATDYVAKGGSVTLTSGYNLLKFENNSNASQAFMTKLKIPFAGRRNDWDAALRDRGSNGYYWSSSPYGSAYPYSARYLNPDSSDVSARFFHRRATGYSVRCFKDEYVAPAPTSKTITYNPYGGAFSGMVVNATKNVVFTKDGNGNYVPDINIQFPNREGYMFDGWYTSSGTQTPANEWTGYVSDDTTVTEVFAKWLTFHDLEVKDDNRNTLFTIMDRNLGATTRGTTCSSSNLSACGKLFQWGNNYGFDNSTSPWPYRTGSASVPYTDLVDASAYGPGNYYSSSTFILRPNGSDYYRWDKTDNANLWGGEGDTATSRGPGTDADRQGPCPANYHVPSILEWKSAYNLLGLTASAKGVTKLQTKLQLPFAGYRGCGDSNVKDQGSNGIYWSSTRSSGNYAYRLYFYSSNIYRQDLDSRSSAFSVRCFKDSPTQTLTFVREDAGTVDSKQVYWYEPIQSSYKPSAPSGTTETWYTDAELTSPFTFGSTTYVTQAKTLYSKVTCSDASSIWDGTECIQQFTVTFNPNNNDASTPVNATSGSTVDALSPAPEKSGYELEGWYTTSGFDDGTKVTFPYTVTDNVQLYAKWEVSCPSGKTYYPEIGACAIKSSENVYYWTDEKSKDVISIIIDDTVLTMLDRNEGATTNSIDDPDSYGYHYQWGNNYGFTQSTTPEKSGSKVEYQNYWPGHPFTGSKFRYGNSMSDYWQNGNYNYLWGGEGDGYTSSIDTFWGGIKNGRLRQGPCPEGYHVPSMGEWNSVVVYWYNTKNSESWPYTDLFTYSSNSLGETFREAFKLPLAGYRNYPNASSYDAGEVGRYWSSSPEMNSFTSAHFLVVNDDLDASSRGGRAYGFSLRCFKDSTGAQATNRVTFQANGGNLLGATDGNLIQLVASGNKAQVPIAPTSNEAGKIFSHWENVNGGSEFVLTGINITQDVTLRAIYSDSTAPVCSISTQPTNTLISKNAGYNQGTVTFTCIDEGGVSTNALSSGAVAYSSNIVSLSDAVVGGTPAVKTFTFTYTAQSEGSTTFSLKAGVVSDLAGNTNEATEESDSVRVDTTAPTITITQLNSTDWTKSKSVSATASDGTLTMKESTSSTCGSGVENFVTYVDKNYTSESDNGTYICYKAVDNAGNETYLSSAKVEKIDTTAPTLASKNSFGDTWYTQNPTSTFTYTDTGAGINGADTRTCEITDEGSASTCEIKNVSVCDNLGNCNTDNQTSNSAKLDRTQPVCGTWTYSPTSQTKTDVTATLAGSTDAISGIKTPGGTCTLTSNDATCDVTIEDNAGLTRVCTSESVNNIDKVKPEGTIQVVTSTPKSTSQEVKLICGDNVGVSSYYWGTNSNPATTAYTSITNTQTNYEVTKTVDAAGTYYLLCKDEAGNISDSKSQVYNSYEVHNMLNAVNKDEGTYNSTNYPQDGSTATYIAPAGTTLALVDVYTAPEYSSANMYKGYTTSVSGTPNTSASVTLNSNSTYYFWFDRTKYDLNLIKNTGIETIYYKVNGATSYSNTGVTASVSMKAGSDAYAYAVASSGYTMTGEYVNYDANTPWERDNVSANQEFAPNTIGYTIIWKDYDGSVLSWRVYYYNDDLVIPSDPSRAADSSYTYTFKGWDPVPAGKVTGDAVYTAVYEATAKGGGSSGGGSSGGSRSKTLSPIEVLEETVNENMHNAAEDEDRQRENEESTQIETEIKTEDSNNASESKYTSEMVEAYQFAKENGITTTQTIDKAKMNTPVTRIEMAKMLSYYAINVLGKKPDVSKGIIKFDDVTNKMNKQYDDAVTKAYQLGIMGQNMKDNKFRPNDKVSRGELVTALSRLLYNTEEGKYKGTGKYYQPHMAKLYNEGIINKSDPNILEKRGYIMIMLMRTIK